MQLERARWYSGTARDGKRRGRARNYRWWLKREAARRERRAARRVLEEAPRQRRYRGWE